MKAFQSIAVCWSPAEGASRPPCWPKAVTWYTETNGDESRAAVWQMRNQQLCPRAQVQAAGSYENQDPETSQRASRAPETQQRPHYRDLCLVWKEGILCTRIAKCTKKKKKKKKKSRLGSVVTSVSELDVLWLTVVDRHFHHHPFHDSVWSIREPPDAHCTRPLTSTGSPLTCNSTWQRIRIWHGTRLHFELRLPQMTTRWRQRTAVLEEGNEIPRCLGKIWGTHRLITSVLHL